MLGHILYRTRQSKQSLTRSAPADDVSMDVQREVNSLDDLASSRPVALSELWSRASLRNKATRSLKSLQLGSNRNENVSEISNDATSTAATPCKPRPRLNSMPHSYSEESHFNGQHKDFFQRPRVQSEVYSLATTVEEKEVRWYAHLDTQVHQNPLSYSTSFDSSYPQCFYHDSHGSSESPLFKSQTFLRMDHASWPLDAYSSHHPGAGSYSQGMIPSNQYMPDPYIEVPHTTVNYEYDQLPYEGLKAQDHHYNNQDIHQIVPPVDHECPGQLQQENTGQASLQAEAECLEAIRQKLLSKVPKSTRVPTSGAAEIRASNPIQVFDASHSRKSSSNSSSSKSSTKRSIKEEATAYLQSVVENAQLEAQRTALQASVAKPGDSAIEECQGPSHKAERSKLLSATLADRKEKVEGRRPSNRKSPLAEKAFKLLCEAASIQQSPLKQDNLHDDESKMVGELPQGLHGGLPTITGKVVGPPPGLPMPSEHKIGTESLYIDNPFKPRGDRLEAANSWFHTDNRGQEQLRQYVAAIAQDDAERSAILHDGSTSASAATGAMQMTLLLGNVIANLHTYVSSDRTKQADYFARYGKAKSRCYEASLGGRRSYFDRDPIIDQWKLPSGSTGSRQSHRSEKKLVFTRLRRSPICSEFSNGW